MFTTFADAFGEMISNAIQRSIFPGAVVVVAAAGRVIFRQAYGSTMYHAAGSQPVTPETIYDVASLTKVFTATAALRLIDQQHMSLHTPVSALLPGFAATSVNLFHLLTHTSGLDIRLSTLRHAGREGLLQTVMATRPRAEPGTEVAYSNINTLLLGEVVAQVTGQPLEHAMEHLVIRPFGLKETQFTPPRDLLSRIAPTEIDDQWRGGLVHGTVHDESAHALGGVAGHAGLFSTADDLSQFCDQWLKALSGQGDRWIHQDLAQQAVTNQTPDLPLACGLGWMLNRPYMGVAPARRFGHTGFTGPVLVVEPERELILIMLNNRVYPQRRPPEHHQVVAALMNCLKDVGEGRSPS